MVIDLTIPVPLCLNINRRVAENLSVEKGTSLG